jgi:hypothetical protein
VQTVSSTSGAACVGQTLSRGGRISIQTNSNYGLLSNLGIANRSAQIDRKLHSASTWTNGWRVITTTTAQTGNNWSYSFSESSAGSYDYRVHFLGLAGSIASSYSSVIQLTFIDASPCPF